MNPKMLSAKRGGLAKSRSSAGKAGLPSGPKQPDGPDVMQDEPAEAAIPAVRIADVASLSLEMAQQWGIWAATYLSVPIALYIIKERRGLSYADLARSLLRIPFGDQL